MSKKFLTLIVFLLTLGWNTNHQVLSAAEPGVIISNSSSNLVALSPRLTISLSRRQVTLYNGNTPIRSYAIAIGKRGWETPTGNFYIMQMMENPVWINPLTGVAIPGGSRQNPLGRYWIGFWTNGTNWIGFHGTPNPESVGRAASHGCIRMYNKDIQELFSQVTMGTPVTVEP